MRSIPHHAAPQLPPLNLTPPRERRAASRMMARACHEMRTPLNAVINLAALLRENGHGTLREEEVRHAERIAANGERLLALVEDLLEAMRLECGAATLDLAPVPPAALVRQAVERCAARAAATRVAVRVEAPRAVRAIVTDPERLQRALRAIVEDAVGRAASAVVVRLVVDPVLGRAARIEVSDDGAPIPADRLATIFDPFDRGAEDGAGEGGVLALALARAVCLRLGYELTVASEIGAGTTFRIGLLTADAAA
jgi:signal transduction histidine kinase